MPYSGGNRLPGERASKLGHLDVVHSELVQELIEQFESTEQSKEGEGLLWEGVGGDEKPLSIIFSVDGSNQVVRSDFPPYREMAFVKTALLRLDPVAMKRVDQEAPHPLALRDLLADAALYHCTVLPLKGVSIPGTTNYDTIRKIIFDSMQDDKLGAEPFKTLKWIAYQKWAGQPRRSPAFECPHCGREIQGLEYDADQGLCDICGEDVYLTDMLGFHLEMTEDASPQSVATAYMLLHEVMLLFTGVRLFWEQEKFQVLENCLFIKDGPLTLRSQYSKLVPGIRDLFDFAKSKGITLHMVGQEKSGAFYDHLEIIARHAPSKAAFTPSNQYIRKEVQKQPERGEPYGSRTNYGNKIFYKPNEFNHLVLNVPTGKYADTEKVDDLIGGRKILATLATLLSSRFEGALVPIELANGIASLSTYPSAKILKVFSSEVLE